MALNWTCDKVEDYKALHEDRTQWLITEVLIFDTLVLGLNTITVENAGIWYDRRNMFRALHESGPDLHWAESDENPNGREYTITLADIERRIGLSTNGSKLTHAGFAKEITRWINERDMSRAYNRKRGI